MILETRCFNDSPAPELKMWKVAANRHHIPTYHHRHANFEICLVTDGSGKYITKNRTYDMEPGDVFVFASNELHYICEIGEGGIALLNLHFSPGFISSSGLLSPENSHFCFSHAAAFENRIPAAEAEGFRKALEDIYRELARKEQEYRMSVKARVCDIILLLIRDRHYSQKQLLLRRGAAQKLSAAVNYIDNHFTEKISVAELAALTDMTPNYFSSLFKKNYRISPCDYIISKRLELSAELLTEGRSSILDIALRCGFNSTANYNKLFKKHYGITPSRYKTVFLN